MAAPDYVKLPSPVKPGTSVDISVNLTAPSVPGNYRGDWFLIAPSGEMFGAGSDGTKPFWAKISVIAATVQFTPTSIPSQTPTPVSTSPALPKAYDFVTNVCNAQWSSGTGPLTCPGAAGDSRGFVLPVDSPRFEDGGFASAPGILTNPNYASTGYIQGIYPDYVVRNGDRFRTIVSCEYGAAQCGALLHLGYQGQDGFIRDIWAFGEFQDGKYYNADIDLSFLAGQKVRFVLSVVSLGAAEDDRIMWIGAAIVNAPLATPAPIPTPPVVPAPPRNRR